MTPPVDPTALTALLDDIRQRQRDFEATTVWACQCDARWHADEFRQWADRLEAALASPATPATEGQTGWQPIATAPKDGTRVLVYIGSAFGLLIARWDTTAEAWMDDEPFAPDPQPTHWRPLPASPPEGQGRAATPPASCGVVGEPEAGRKVCELPAGHEGYHQQGHVRWLGYFPKNAAAPPAALDREATVNPLREARKQAQESLSVLRNAADALDRDALVRAKAEGAREALEQAAKELEFKHLGMTPWGVMEWLRARAAADTGAR